MIMSEKAWQSIRRFEKIQSLFLLVLGLFSLCPLANHTKFFLIMMSIYFLTIGATSVARGCKSKNDENLFQVAVAGGIIYIIIGCVIFRLMDVVSFLIAIILGLFILITVVTKWFFYHENIKLTKLFYLNVSYFMIGFFMLFIPSYEVVNLKIIFGITMISMSVTNFIVMIKNPLP